MNIIKKIIYLFFLVVVISPVFVQAEVVGDCNCQFKMGIPFTEGIKTPLPSKSGVTEEQCLVYGASDDTQKCVFNADAASQKKADEDAKKCPDDRICLENPLDTVLIPEVFGNAIKIVTGIMGSLALLVFVYGGFMWLTAAGNSEQVKKGTTAMIWATIGIIVVFSSYAIITLVLSALGAT